MSLQIPSPPVSAYTINNLRLGLQNLNVCFDMMESAFENLPEYTELIEYYKETVPHADYGNLKKITLRNKLLSISFNEEYETEEPDEDGEYDALIGYESGYVALAHAAESLDVSFRYLLPALNTGELPETSGVALAFNDMKNRYEESSHMFMNGHWWTNIGLSNESAIDKFFEYLMYMYRLRYVVQKTLDS